MKGRALATCVALVGFLALMALYALPASATKCSGAGKVQCYKNGCGAGIDWCSCPPFCKASPWPCKSKGGAKVCLCGSGNRGCDWACPPYCAATAKANCKAIQEKQSTLAPQGACCKSPRNGRWEVQCNGPEDCYTWGKRCPEEDGTIEKSIAFCGGNSGCMNTALGWVTRSEFCNESACAFIKSACSTHCDDNPGCVWEYTIDTQIQIPAGSILGSAGCYPYPRSTATPLRKGKQNGCTLTLFGNCYCQAIVCGNVPNWGKFAPPRTACSCKGLEGKLAGQCVSEGENKRGLCECFRASVL